MLIMAPAIELIGTTFVDHAWRVGGGDENGGKGSLNAGDPITIPAYHRGLNECLMHGNSSYLDVCSTTVATVPR